MSFFDDCGREWSDDAEWCDRCQGMGTEECLCAGDFCCCGAGDNLTCRRCGGEGYFVPTAEFKAARERTAKWWLELNESLPTPPQESQQ